MAIFRVMRIGGVATFASAPPDTAVPETSGPVFRANRSPEGVALFREQTGVSYTPLPPEEYVPVTYDELVQHEMGLLFDEGQGLVFEDELSASITLTDSLTPSRQVEDSTRMAVLLSADMLPQIHARETQSESFELGFETFGRIAGWESALPPKKPPRWTPQPKPKTY